MQITITLDTEKLSPADISFLGALAGQEQLPKAAAATPAKAAPAAEKPAAKATKAKPEPKAEPEPETGDDEPDATPSADEEGDGPTMQDAVELATKLVSNGEAKRVKEALADAGAKRVSELKADKVADFIAALS